MESPQTITANATPDTILKARRRALDEGKSLRVWAGEAIAARLKTHRDEMKRGAKLASK